MCCAGSGANEDPDIFRYAYGSGSFPPKGGNRGRYSNPKVDALLAEAAASTDQTTRQKDYVQVQQILAEDLPGITLCSPDNEVVRTTGECAGLCQRRPATTTICAAPGCAEITPPPSWR